MTDLDYAKVIGRFGLTVGDTGTDPDDDPDTVWCTEGRVIITPLNTFVKVAGGSPVPWTGGNAQIECAIDGNGYLTYTAPGGTTKQFVEVVDLTSSKVNPQITTGATHRVTFADVKSGTTPVAFPTFTCRLTAAGDGVSGTGINDLTIVAPIVPGEAQPITRGPQGVSIESLAVNGLGQLEVDLDDGTTVNAGALPVGPGGSDAGVAGYLSTSGASSRAAARALVAGDIANPTSDVGIALSASYAAKPRTGTKAVGQGELFVNVMDYSAVGDGTADDTTPLTNAAAAALSAGRTLYIPRGVILRITSTVNLVGIDVDARGTIRVDYLGGPGVTAGGDSTGTVTRVLRFDRVEHAAGTGQSVPALRLVGIKNGITSVNYCHYLQLYADAASNTTDSIAYSSFFLGNINKLELYGAAGTSWINENRFYAGRVTTFVMDAVTYQHNGNKFYGLCLESGTFTLNAGASNTFYDMRGEGGGTITFGTGTHHNVVLGSWASTATVATSPFTVSDNGLRNQVIPLELRTSRVVELACLDNTTRMFNGGAFELTQGTPGLSPAVPAEALTAKPGFVKLLSDNNACHIDTGLISISRTGGDFPGRLQRFNLRSDAAIWRPRVYFYDANRTQLSPGASDPGYMSTSGGWTWNASGYYTFSSDSTGQRIAPTGHPDVAYIRIMVIGSTTNALFEWVRIEALVDDAYSDTLAQRAQRRMRRTPALAAAPTMGFARVGDTVEKTTAAGAWKCTARNDSTLSVAKTAGDTVMSLVSGTGFTAGDVIGVELDDGSTHWTTVLSVSTNDVTLTAALPAGAAAAIGRRVAAMRWV